MGGKELFRAGYGAQSFYCRAVEVPHHLGLCLAPLSYLRGIPEGDLKVLKHGFGAVSLVLGLMNICAAASLGSRAFELQ